MGRAATELAGRELLDGLESALPTPQPTETARRILDVMRRISFAATASLYREEAGMLRRIAGARLPGAAVRRMRAALRHDPDRGAARFSSIWVAEPGSNGWERSWVLWSGRPRDAERDVVYIQGPALRAAGDCADRLKRLIALLGPLP